MTLEQLEETKIDNQRVILADCFDVMKSWPDGYVDTVLTSVPFLNSDLGFEDDSQYYIWFDRFLMEASRIAKDYLVVFNSSRRIKEIFRHTDPYLMMVWDKRITQMPYRYEPIFVYKCPKASWSWYSAMWTDCFAVSPIMGGKNRKDKHPYENPVMLFQYLCYLIKKGKRDSVILDPFCGSGTTIRACFKLDMKGIGIEKEKKWYNMAVKRLETFRGQERLQFE